MEGMNTGSVPTGEMDSEKPADDCVVCNNCLHGNRARANFCEKCGMPLSTYAVIAPFERIQSYGWFLQKLIASRPSTIMLLGAWLLFGPLLLSFLFGLHATWNQLSMARWQSMLSMIPGYVCIIAYMVILYKVTRNYVRKREVCEAEEQEE